jgi:hypothetical protein
MTVTRALQQREDNLYEASGFGETSDHLMVCQCLCTTPNTVCSNMAHSRRLSLNESGDGLDVTSRMLVGNSAGWFDNSHLGLQMSLPLMAIYWMVQKSPHIGRKVAMEFNRKHGKHITHDTVAKLTDKFIKSGSVADQPRCGRPRTSTMMAQPTWRW